MRKTEEIRTHGLLFRIRQLPFGKARSLLLRLTKLLGPAISQATSDPLSAFAGCVSRLSDEDLESITADLSTDCEYSPDGDKWISLSNKSVRENAFVGNLQAYFGFLYEALRVNYADFFGEMGLSLGAAPPDQKTK